MTRRRTSRKQRRIQKAADSGDDVPDPISMGTAMLVGSVLSAGTAIATPFLAKGSQKSPSQNTAGMLSKPKTQMLNAGQKTDLINTSPQGVLSSATTNRSTLLGN